MILIIESGATKADWCAVAGDGIPVFIKTGWINLATMSEEVNETTVNQALAELEAKDLREKVDRIHFYAAGLVSAEGDEVPELARGLDKVLKAHFPDAVIEYASDLLRVLHGSRRPARHQLPFPSPRWSSCRQTP